MENLCAVILAAGKGTRMRSNRAKVLHNLCGTPMLRLVYSAVAALEPEQVFVVIGQDAERVCGSLEGFPAYFVHQKEQLGLGHAVLMAKELVGDEPFAVLLSDDVIVNPGGKPVTGQLIETYQAHRGSVIALQRVDRSDVSRYGVVAPRHEEGPLVEIGDLVEKPAVDDAPSDLAVLGRYVLSPKIFDVLETTPRGAGGEIQLTDAIRELSHEQPVFGYQFSGVRHDAGTRIGWLQANIAMALESDDADEVRAFVRGLDLRD